MDAQAAGTDKGTKKCKFEIDQLFSSQLMSCRALVHQVPVTGQKRRSGGGE